VGWLGAALLAVATLAAPAAPEVLVGPVVTPWTGDLDGMRERGYVRVLVSYSRTNFFIHEGHARGLEAELMQRWARSLNEGVGPAERGTDIVFVPVPFQRLLPDLLAGRGDVAAAGLTVTPERSREVAFTAPYLPDVAEVVVTSPLVRGLESTDDLAGRTVDVVRGSSYVRSLRALSQRLVAAGRDPVIVREAEPYLALPDLLELVNAGVIELTIADRHVAELWARAMPDLVLRDDLRVESGGHIAWATRPESQQLRDSLNRFIGSHRKGTLTGNVLFNRYFESSRWIGDPTRESERRKLDSVVSLFQKYGDRYGFDWLLLAAQAYRESRLDNSVRSQAGAVGIMQVRPETASDPAVGIDDVHELENNVHAGTKYLAYLRDRYFSKPEVTASARIHFSLAAYNAGPARVRRLRRRAQEMGLDPDRWFGHVERVALTDVGREPVRYVADVRKYYVAYKLSREELLERERRVRARARP
jgi:membrane-bound lytic murein transglycosylase MltF